VRNGIRPHAVDLSANYDTHMTYIEQFEVEFAKMTLPPETGQFPKRVLANKVAGATRSQDETEAIQ